MCNIGKFYTMLLYSASAVYRAFRGLPGAPGGTSNVSKNTRRETPAPAAPRHGGHWSSMCCVLICLICMRHHSGPPEGPGRPDIKRKRCRATLHTKGESLATCERHMFEAKVNLGLEFDTSEKVEPVRRSAKTHLASD
jgi:hypothetical protein